MNSTRLLTRIAACRWVAIVLAVLAVAAAHAADAPAAAPAPSAEEGLSFLDLFFKGGWLMAPITLCSVIGLAFVFERFLTVRRARHLPAGFFDDVAARVRAGEARAAEGLCRGGRHALARILRAVLLCEGGSRGDMEAAIETEGGRVVWDLRRNGKVLGVVAGVAPLLGLLGTVWGMIRAFETYARAGGAPKPDLLATGIYEALITTAAGLSVAIPCLLFFHYFRGRTDTLVREIEDLGLELINIVLERRRAGGAGDQRAAP